MARRASTLLTMNGTSGRQRQTVAYSTHSDTKPKLPARSEVTRFCDELNAAKIRKNAAPSSITARRFARDAARDVNNGSSMTIELLDEPDEPPRRSSDVPMVVEEDAWYVRLLLRVPWSVAANALFLLGSLLWFVSPLVCEAANETNEWAGCEASVIAATSVFFVDALFYFGAWWALKRSGRQSPFQRSLLAGHRRGWARRVQQFDFLFWGNWLFMIGTGLDFVTSYLSFNLDDLLWSRITYLLSMVLWLLYASFEVTRASLNIRNRRTLHARVCISWRATSDVAEIRRRGYPLGVERLILPWDLMGAVLFMLASMLYTTASIVCWAQVTLSCLPYELSGATTFVLNAIVCFLEDAEGTRCGAAFDEFSTTALSSMVTVRSSDQLLARAASEADMRDAHRRLQELAVGLGKTVLEVAVRDDEH